MTPLITDEPAVLTWAIALANRDRFLPAEPPRRHWWRELVTTHWRDSHDQWLKHRERECSGWSTEEAEYAAKYPRPTLKAFVVGLASGRIEPGGCRVNPYGTKPPKIDRAALAEWNERQDRAREEYAINPLTQAGTGRCDMDGCRNKTGKRRYCWQHRLMQRMEGS